MTIEADVFYFSSWVALGTGVLCMLSAAVVALCFFAFPDLRSSWRLYVLCLSFCDFLQGVFYAVDGARTFHYEPTGHPSNACYGFALLGIWSASSSFLWTACVSIYVAGFLVRRMQSGSTERGRPAAVTALFCSVAFGFPSVMLVLLVVNDVPISHNRKWDDSYGCFIAHDDPEWRFATMYVPLWASMIAIVVSSAFTYCQLTSVLASLSVLDTQQPLNLRRLRRKVLLIPLAFVLCRLPESIYRCVEYSGGGTEWLASSSLGKALNGLQAFANPAQGLVTSLIFVWTSPAYRRRLRLLLRAARDRKHRSSLPACAGGRVGDASAQTHTAPLLDDTLSATGTGTFSSSAPATASSRPSVCTSTSGPGVGSGAESTFDRASAGDTTEPPAGPSVEPAAEPPLESPASAGSSADSPSVESLGRLTANSAASGPGLDGVWARLSLTPVPFGRSCSGATMSTSPGRGRRHPSIDDTAGLEQALAPEE